jgi:hypothetical protein
MGHGSIFFFALCRNGVCSTVIIDSVTTNKTLPTAQIKDIEIHPKLIIPERLPIEQPIATLRTELIVEKNLIDNPSYICYK